MSEKKTSKVKRPGKPKPSDTARPPSTGEPSPRRNESTEGPVESKVESYLSIQVPAGTHLEDLGNLLKQAVDDALRLKKLPTFNAQHKPGRRLSDEDALLILVVTDVGDGPGR